jgi:hypothetical protein
VWNACEAFDDLVESTTVDFERYLMPDRQRLSASSGA